MSELEDKLNTILSDPDAMGQIMSLARSLGGGKTEDRGDPPPSAGEEDRSPPPAGGDPFSLLSGVDPRFLDLGMRLMSAYQSEDNDRAALLTALRPFVRAERYAKLDQAIQISRLARVVRIALDAFRNREGGDGHV